MSQFAVSFTDKRKMASVYHLHALVMIRDDFNMLTALLSKLSNFVFPIRPTPAGPEPGVLVAVTPIACIHRVQSSIEQKCVCEEQRACGMLWSRAPMPRARIHEPDHIGRRMVG